MIRDINPGPLESNPQGFRIADRQLASSSLVYFYANSQLYVTDGTSSGTCPVILSGLPDGHSALLTTAVSSELFFTIVRSDSEALAYSTSVFVAHTPADNVDVCPGTLALLNVTNLYQRASYITTTVSCAGYIYFVARENLPSSASGESDNLLRLWRTLSFSEYPVHISQLEVSDAPGSIVCAQDNIIFVNGRVQDARLSYKLLAVASNGSFSSIDIGFEYSDPCWLTPIDGNICWSAYVLGYPTGRVLACAAISHSTSPVVSQAAVVAPDDVQLSHVRKSASMIAYKGRLYFLCRRPNMAGPYYACSYKPVTPDIPPVKHDDAPPAASYSNFVPVWPIGGPALVLYPVRTSSEGLGDASLYAIEA